MQRNKDTNNRESILVPREIVDFVVRRAAELTAIWATKDPSYTHLGLILLKASHISDAEH